MAAFKQHSHALPQPAEGDVSAPLKENGAHSDIWERRLFDLSPKNPLLDLTNARTLRIVCEDADALAGDLTRELLLCPAEGRGRSHAAERRREGVLLAAGEVPDTAFFLYRRSLAAEEETGACVLYLALGFLEYVREGARRRAPLLLLPVRLRRRAGSGEWYLSRAGDMLPNGTLFELLRREYELPEPKGENCLALRSEIEREIGHLKGWKTADGACLAVLSFRRCRLWNDLRLRLNDYARHPVVHALLGGGKVPRRELSLPTEDEYDPASLFLPLPADSSQFGAVALSDAGESFVLYGPPGTGKSQTIANIIANALAKGRRVLFVAEKRAAIEVVKSRLEAAGIGEFCLDLHGDNVNGADAIKRLERTLSLKNRAETSNFSRGAEEFGALRGALVRAENALCGKRAIGMSVREGILRALRPSAPELFEVSPAFTASLTPRTFAEIENSVRAAMAAAKECGGVADSPFSGVELTEWSQNVRNGVVFSAETLLAEIRHLREMHALLLRLFRQSGARSGEESVRGLALLCEEFAVGKYAAYFPSEDAAPFYAANAELDALLSEYGKKFRIVVRPAGDEGKLAAFLEGGGDWKLDRAARLTAEKLRRVSVGEWREEDVFRSLSVLLRLRAALARVRAFPLSARFLSRGRVKFGVRDRLLAPVRALHGRASALFSLFDAPSFDAACAALSDGCARPILQGYIGAAERYFSALGAFRRAAKWMGGSSDPEEAYLRASSLLEHIDLLPNRCLYRRTAEELGRRGLRFLGGEERLGADEVLSALEGSVAKSFVRQAIAEDPDLSRRTAGTLHEGAEAFRTACGKFEAITREHVRARLLSRLPAEAALLYRLMREQKPDLAELLRDEELSARLAPCLFMSPASAARFLPPRICSFDLVVFDEASQLTAEETAGAIARGKAVVIAGDPNQLPPASFFRSSRGEESLLDAALAAGLREHRLVWHYRSRHESLIAFSNAMYYGNALRTFPSPSKESRVHLVRVDGVYGRGGSKCNRAEAEALVAEIVRRLKHPELSRASMGVVTFSGAQQELIEKLLDRELAGTELYRRAYGREEPLFVKNLENVQGDERDVIFFSVCYGPDARGKLALNFGPLNRAGGWRRLNVAVSRAREEMAVYTSMTSSMLGRSASGSGLKEFLAYAEGGTLPAENSGEERGGLAPFLAAELSRYGYRCTCGLGASGFRVDVAVADPSDGKYLLAILCDGEGYTVRDRYVLQERILRAAGWEVLYVDPVSCFNNPKRELKRIKTCLDRLTGRESRAFEWLKRYQKPYRAVRRTGAGSSSFVTEGGHDAEISARLGRIVSLEQPISRAFLRKRCMQSFGIGKGSALAHARLDALIDGCGFLRDRAAGREYFYRDPRALLLSRVRVEGERKLRTSEEDFTAYEILSLVRGALEERVALYMGEVCELAERVLGGRGEEFSRFVRDCVRYGEERGLFACSDSDRVTLA